MSHVEKEEQINFNKIRDWDAGGIVRLRGLSDGKNGEPIESTLLPTLNFKKINQEVTDEVKSGCPGNGS